jgi:hypothetical protein
MRRIVEKNEKREQQKEYRKETGEGGGNAACNLSPGKVSLWTGVIALALGSVLLKIYKDNRVHIQKEFISDLNRFFVKEISCVIE